MTLLKAPTAPMNVLSFRFRLVELDPDDGGGGLATLRPEVDGVDLLDTPRDLQGCDPDDLLRRRAVTLLPLAAASLAAIGVCGCGDLGCGSLRVTVTRRGDVVEWRPAPVRDTVERTYRFGLLAYLDALEQARGLRPFEGRGRRVADAVERRLGSDPDRSDHPLVHGRDTVGTTIESVSAWPWTSDVVRVSVVPPDGPQDLLAFDPLPGEDDEAFTHRVTQSLLELAWPQGQS